MWYIVSFVDADHINHATDDTAGFSAWNGWILSSRPPTGGGGRGGHKSKGLPLFFSTRVLWTDPKWHNPIILFKVPVRPPCTTSRSGLSLHCPLITAAERKIFRPLDPHYSTLSKTHSSLPVVSCAYTRRELFIPMRLVFSPPYIEHFARNVCSVSVRPSTACWQSRPPLSPPPSLQDGKEQQCRFSEPEEKVTSSSDGFLFRP